jgi:hypothetical protein
MRLGRTLQAILIVLTAVVAHGALTPAHAAPEGAATGLSLGSETCQAGGKVSLRLSWTSSRLGEQYVELAIDAAFARHSSGGPYAATASSVVLTELTSGATYYARVRTVAGGQNLYSEVVAVTPQTCAAPSAGGTSGGTFNLVSAHSGRCLEIYGISQANFASANQWYCWGGGNQAVQAIPMGDGYFQLRFAHSGRCLEVMNWRTDNGAPIGQYACHNGDNQRWTGSFSHGAQSTIRNKFSAKCLDVYGWGLGDGAPVLQWDCHAGNNQQWRVRVAGSSPSTPSNPAGPIIALTIDTDTIRGFMPQVLDTLDAYGVKASFGVTGAWANSNPDLVRRMVASGHTIMNHSFDHPSSASLWPRCSSIIAPDQIWPIGLAMPLPAMSGAEPCTGSNIEGNSRSGLMLAEGAMPMVPVHGGPRSERMSPKRFEPTTTSNQSGCCTKCAVRMSMWYWSVARPG